MSSLSVSHHYFSELSGSLWSESRKALRSKTLWITVVSVIFLTLICGLFMYILKDPEQARQLGLIGAKAQLFGGPSDWANFFNLLFALISVAGLVIFGFIFVWIFGREFGNKTVYDLLALPTSRITIVTAKILVAFLWSLVLLVIIALCIVLVGTVLDLPGSQEIITNGLKDLLITGLLTIPLCIPFAMIASFTRGYLPAVGAIFLVIITGQVFNGIGYSQYFPWSLPGVYSGGAEALTGQVPEPAEPISYLLAAVVCILAFAGTLLWWKYADQS